MSIEDVKRLREELARKEAKEGNSGAVPLTPKEALLDAREVEAQHPDKRVRWVNIRSPEKAQSRIAQGYVRLSDAEGGKHLGDDLALMAIPREKYDATVERNRKLAEERLKNRNSDEMERVAESVAKILRDKHGLKVPLSRLLVNEE